MTKNFGPWTTAAGAGSKAHLSTFWRRRLAMLPATHRSRTRLGGRIVSLLLMTATVVWTLPTLRGADSSTAQSDSAVATTEGTEAERVDVDGRAHAGSAAIRGPWRAVRMEDAGHKVPASAVRQLTLVVDEKTFIMRQGQQLIANTPYTVDASQTPPAIQLTYQGQATHGVWERKGDTLTLCLADAGQARPKKFVVGPEGGRLLLVFRISEEGERIPLLVMDVDGKNFRKLISLPEYTAIGSPSWSPDGKRITFDAWRTVFGESFSPYSHVFVANADGTDARDLGDGTGPSWSPDGKRLTLYRYGDNYGVWIMNADGTGKELLDGAGWGSKWSPCANRIAYTIHARSGANLCIRDLDKAESRTLLTRAYRGVYWGLMWSPDGQWIAFKADTPDGKSELAAVHVEGEAKGFKVLLPKAMPESGDRFTSHIAWGGDGKHVLVGLCAPNRQWGHKMYFLDFAQKEPPQLVPGPYPDGYLTGIFLSRDGKKILFGYSVPKPSPEKPTRPAVEPKSRGAESLERLYALGDGEVLKRVAPPFSPSRLVYYRERQPTQAEHIPEGPSAMYFRFRDGRLKNWGLSFGGPYLSTIVGTLAGVYPQETEGDAKLIRTEVEGDWIVREGTPTETIIGRMDEILRKECKLPIKLALREVDREVIVAKGDYSFTPLPGHRQIEIYGETLVTDGTGRGGSGDFDQFLRWVEMFIERRVVSDVQYPPKDRLSWHYNARSPSAEQQRKADHDERAVLKHLTQQTGLSFTKEERRVRVLFVEKVN